jgi:hypothetical protein
LLLIAAVIAAAWTFSRTPYAKQKPIRTILAALLFIILAGALFFIGHKQDVSSNVVALTEGMKSPDTKKNAETRPEKVSSDDSTNNKSKTKTNPKPSPSGQSSKGDKNPIITTNGPCSPVQVNGGTQTTNCGPPPPQFELTTLQDSVKVSESHYETRFILKIIAEQPIQFLFLKAEAPTITGRIFFVPEGVNGVFSTQQRAGRSGPGYLSTNYEGIVAGTYVITISCTEPGKVTLTYDPTLHN